MVSPMQLRPLKAVVRTLWAVGTMGLMTAGAAAWAQTGLNLNARQSENQKALHAYRWQVRTVYRVDGKRRREDVYFAKYDENGKIAETLVGGQRPASPDSVVTPGHTFEAEQERNRLGNMALALSLEITRYENLPEERQRALMEAAKRTPDGDLEQVHLTDILKAGDSATVWMDRKTGLQRRVELHGTLDNDPFDATYTFADLRGGAVYPATILIRIPAKRLEVTTTNSGYLRVAR